MCKYFKYLKITISSILKKPSKDCIYLLNNFTSSPQKMEIFVFSILYFVTFKPFLKININKYKNKFYRFLGPIYFVK